MIKLALTDLDNTLIPMGAPHASMRAIAAIHAMLDAGLHFGPVSGRVPAAMRWMFGGDESCSQTGAFVNGQLIYVDGELVHQETLDGRGISDIASWVQGYEGCALVVYDLDDLSETTDGTSYYLGTTEDELARHESVFGRHPHVIDRLEHPTYIKSNLRCDMPWDQMVALRNELREQFPAFDFVFPALHGPFIDILPHGWSKGHAVKVLADHLGLSLEEVAVFGDSENDVSMLEAVPNSVAVRNASPEAMAAARFRIGLSTDDAVADALFALAKAAETGECPTFLRPLSASHPYISPAYLGERKSTEETTCDMMKPLRDECVLVTGGCGFIGSHTVVELLKDGYEVVVIDDLSNSSKAVLMRIGKIVGKDALERLSFYQANVNDRKALDTIFKRHQIGSVIHFAGFKAVGESVAKPIEYFSNNIGCTLSLVDTMRDHGCKSIVFSSSATVYGDPDALPLTEGSPKKFATNPYGWTKWMIEEILKSLVVADPEWNVVLLRYFNPIGAHPTGLIGEDPKGIPNNLVPYVAQVAVGRREAVHVYGADYDTPDGTGVRDYIHVVDLARGHAAALEWMQGRNGCEVFNLGTGKGTSVLEVIKAYSEACGRELPYVVEQRRAGDVTANWADCTKAREKLGWEAEYDIKDMCRDSWRWQSHNPFGYEE